MDKDRIKGSAEQAKGKVKEWAGKITGDTKTESEGKADQVKGKVQQHHRRTERHHPRQVAGVSIPPRAPPGALFWPRTASVLLHATRLRAGTNATSPLMSRRSVASGARIPEMTAERSGAGGDGSTA